MEGEAESGVEWRAIEHLRLGAAVVAARSLVSD